MKKTIAILLILVIGMVGVFADDPSPAEAVNAADQIMKINAEIKQVNLMVLSATDTPNWEQSATINETIEDNDEVSIGFIHTKSNHRGGYTVTMTPGPLGSTVDGATFLQYKVNAYDSSETLKGTSTTGTLLEGLVGSAPGTGDVIIASGNLTGMASTYRDIQVQILTDLDTALAGEYSADITFEYAAL